MAIVWSVPPPTNMRGRVGDDVTLRIEATTTAEPPDITYTVVEHPPGLTLGETTGDINGTLTTVGVYEAVYTATDGNMDTVDGPSQWVVTPDVQTVHDVLVTREQLRELVSTPTGHEDALDLCCILATHWVKYRVGELTLEEEVEAFPPYVLIPVPANPGRLRAAQIAATRFWASPQAPFGVMGGFGDLATRVSASIPEAELALQGQRTAFGIA